MNRKIFHLLGTLFLFSLWGCVNDPYEVNPLQVSRSEVNISGSIYQKSTRATAEGFVDGDAVGIYVVNYSNSVPGTLLDKGNQANHVKYVFNELENKWVPEYKVYYKDDNTHVDIYGYYPYDRPESVNAYDFEVAVDQRNTGDNGSMGGYEASDFLWGKASDITPTESAVKITYDHILSCAVVVLKQGEGFADGEFEQLDASVLVTGVTRNATIDLAKGEVTSIGDLSAEGTIMASSDDGFRSIVVPQSVPAQESLFAITLDGVNYKFRKDTALEYRSGEMNKFTIVLNKKSLTGTYELVLDSLEVLPWSEDSNSHTGESRQYYVVNVEEPGTLGSTLASLNKDGAKIKNMKVTGTIDNRDFHYMRDSMTVLQALNLKEVKIAESYYSWSGGDHYGKFDYVKSPANEIPEKALQSKSSLYYFAFPENITKIGEEAFRSTSITGSLIIPDGVIEIGDSAFAGNENLTELSLPQSLKRIGKSAFSGCGNIKGNLSLPSGVEYIGAYAFYYCSNFTGPLILPESLTEIGNNAFHACAGFTGSLTIPSGVKRLYGSTFEYCSGLRGQLNLHDGITSIGDRCFNNCHFTGELILPKELGTIESSTFQSCLFSSIVAFPEGLKEIKTSAFSGCWRLMGVLEFPKELINIESNAFTGCKTLEGIILNENLSLIYDYAFSGCYYINKIECKSLQPPVLMSGVFNGVSKENFTVEVPERSINQYLVADGWSDFNRISAYRDFSINRRSVGWLNGGGTTELYLKTLNENSWSVTEKPDWVTVEPMSGTGKVEVKVITNEMTASDVTTFVEMAPNSNGNIVSTTYNGRTGKVVFTLNGTDYTQTLTINQHDYEYDDGDVVQLKSATKGDGIDIVILGDCYDAADIASGAYLENITEGAEHMFTVEPYKTYADYFNVYGVFGLSTDSGMGTVNNLKEACFGSQYFTAHGIEPNIDKCFEYACKAPIDNKIAETLVILIPNTTEYAGITYMYGDGSAVAVCPMSADAYPYDFRGLIQHEAGGHGFAKLGDEYIYVNYWIDKNCTCSNPHDGDLRAGKALGWYRNLSLTGDVNLVDWSHLIFHPTYANIVDVYEGGYFHTLNVWRSEPNSCMNNNIPYFNAISRQTIVERIKELAGETFNFDEFVANDKLFMDNSSTRALDNTPQISAGAGMQHPPVYMGDKPSFNPNKK